MGVWVWVGSCSGVLAAKEVGLRYYGLCLKWISQNPTDRKALCCPLEVLIEG